MKRILTRVAAGSLMFIVALLCAFFAMRIAIHGREVTVPNLSGRSDADAAAEARKLGLNLSVENRFYSAAIAPNHVLSQSPAAGARVRRGWQVRVTESLGGQHVEVPDLTGQSERPASLVLRRVQLELGTVAHLPAPGPTGVVLAQSPPPNSAGLDGPRVSLLVGDEDNTPAASAYVMPSIVGLTLAAASARLATAGLHISSATEPEQAPAIDPGSATAAAASVSLSASTPGLPEQAFDVPITPPPISVNATIISQSPAPGHRVSRADSIRVILSR